MTSGFGIRAAGFLVAIALSATASGQTPPTLEDVLQRMGAYLDEYANQLPATIATEIYEQRATWPGRGPVHRQLVSEYGIVRSRPESPWQGFREVVRVDGKPIADSARRLMELLSYQTPTSLPLARRIAEESSRFNIGSVARTINDPALPLALLDPRHKKQMRFALDGESTVDGKRIWIVKFEEIGRPTIVHRTEDLKHLPADGRAWIDPQNGGIVKAELSVEPGFGLECRLEVSFEPNAQMGFAVPAMMVERCFDRNWRALSWGEARYSNYRRFTVVTEEDISAR